MVDPDLAHILYRLEHRIRTMTAEMTALKDAVAKLAAQVPLETAKKAAVAGDHEDKAAIPLLTQQVTEITNELAAH